VKLPLKAKNPRAKRPTAPGDALASTVEDMVRVDHAGETAAVAIYQAQQRVFGAVAHKREITHTLAEMEHGEHVHLDAFNDELSRRNARPTALIGVWQPLSFALGAATALMGEKSAHACTEAVENVIEEHYQGQIDALETAKTEPELRAMFQQFREDELGHRDTAIEEGAHEAPAYPLLTGFIKAGCRTAIALSEKI
jgi:3-demethoxyubiquinol 3-hydroxylase